jgi:lipopolysaccharide export system protein LptC
MSWRGILTLVLLVAAAVSGWSAWRQRESTAAPVAASTRPSYLLRDFELIALDKEGKESFVLRAPQLSQDPNDKTMTISTPLFLLPDKDGKHWNVRSRTAWVSADNKEVRLRDQVMADSPPGDGRPSTMRTEQLNVFPDTNQATSAALVTVTAPGSTMQGTGMRVDMKTKRILLLSKVSSTYEPKRR